MSVLKTIHSKLSKKGEIKATFFYLLSNICTKAFGFITIPLYTHILTTSEYGYLNTYNAWVSLLSVIMGLSLSSAIMGKVNLDRKSRAEFQSSVMALSIAAACILTVIVTSAYILIYGEIDIIVLLALIQGYGSFVVNFILQEFVLDNRYILHSVISVGSVAIPIGVTCLIINKVFQNQKYLSVIVPRAVVIIALMLIFIAFILLRGRVLYNKESWLWSLKYCIPIVFHSLSLTIMLQADRIMLSYLYGYDESGVYSFIYNVTLVIGVLIAALENTWKTWFFNNYDKADAALIQKRCRLFISVAIIGVSVYIFVAPELVKILAAEEYQTQIFLIGPIAFAYIISFFYDFLVYVEYKKEATKNIAIASMVAALVNIGLNFVIIPRFGGVGAACTTCVAYIVQFSMHLLVVKKLERNLFTFKIFVPFIIAGIIILTVFHVTLNLAFVRYLLVVAFLIVFFMVVYRNRAYLT